VPPGNPIVPVEVSTVSRFEADGDYVLVHTAARRHMMRVNLRDLEASLATVSFACTGPTW
jgi:DNA-binding LytR/AlgR family response regulator